ncbi:hereditary hemochromatosis protein homolog [Seriola lalandi dorsalis]|uniref:hereditary hemochromatosis protein homolog n=1 Tax=Seriola lalandi dorsalis TaxID=1841481 RepID=UPI000C6F68A9|nr:hereditary hemochromatosis protein homolog [Seriola lalandi dorsalis]XP_023249421.1 hereditary hemochromatosis protein homolog [Seriola lalandi dorsalis]
MFVIRLMIVSLFVHQVMSSGSGRHSLWVLASYISGTTPFPEFSVVLMLDDVQVGYYDSELDRMTRVGRAGEEGAELGLRQEAVFVLREMFSNMGRRLTLVKHRFNLTAGVHVQQRVTGCEVLEDGQPALIMFRDGSNGQDADSLMYNMTHFTYAGREGGEIQWDAVKKTYFQMLYSNIYLPLCVRTLRTLLDREKHLVMRRVRPRVRLINKQVVGGAQVTCLATDFYPRHINLTLLRDSRPVDEDELTGGSVLPNGNGLYQVRKTLTVGNEELRRKHNYTCTTSHLSLDNRLEVSWRAEFSRSYRVHIISAPVGLMVAVLLLLVLLWRRRRSRRSEGVAMETQEQPEEHEL